MAYCSKTSIFVIFNQGDADLLQHAEETTQEELDDVISKAKK